MSPSVVAEMSLPSLVRPAVLSTILLMSAASATTREGCAAGGKLVQSFAVFRDEGKPLSDVDAFIATLPGAGTEQQAFYRKLARTTYAQESLSPEEARDSFVRFCTAPAPGEQKHPGKQERKP